MRTSKFNFLQILSVFIFLLFPAFSNEANAQKNDSSYNYKYRKIIVEKFDIKEDVEKFSDESTNIMMAEIIDELKKTGKFKEVSMATSPITTVVKSDIPEVKPAENKEETKLQNSVSDLPIRLVGTITKYKEGDRALRWVVGFGAGKTKLVAHIKFLDTNNNVLFEKDVDGKVIIGFFGGESSGATRGLAKEVAKVALKKFF